VPLADRGDPVQMSGKDLDGKPLSLADYRGQVVVVNVWWSACPPCRTEMPTLVKAAASKDHPAAYVGIDIRDSDVAQAQAFARRFDVPFPSVFDPSGKALLPFAGTLSPRTVPSTVVLDPQGRIAAAVIGPVPTQTTLEDLIDDAGKGSHG
jgi:peroxiredoxin